MELDTEQKELLNGVFQEAVALFLTFTVLTSAVKLGVERTGILATELPGYLFITATGFFLGAATLVFKGVLAVKQPDKLRQTG